MAQIQASQLTRNSGEPDLPGGRDHVLPRRADVVVIGGGNAALCAAIEASERGRSVVVLEHAGRDMRGGNTRHTRNLRAMHAAPTATLTGSYSADEYWQDLLRVTAGNTDEPLARMMIEQSEDLLEWLHARGVRFQPALSGTLSLACTNAFFLGGGKTLLNTLYRVAEQRGVSCFYNTEVTGLVVEDGRCSAIRCRRDGEEHVIEAQAVVVACGGFQANPEWLREAWGEAADNFLIRGTPYNRGRVLRALMRQGASTVGEPTQCHAVAIDARAPKYDGGIVTRLDCVCFGIVVNRDGERFYDEGEDFWPKRYAIWGRLIADQPGQVAYAIIDAKALGNFMPSVFSPVTAGSIAALAEELGIDPAALATTVAEFNGAVTTGTYDPGSLDDCTAAGIEPVKSHWALPLDTPPFYAYPLRPGITFTYLGLKVDTTARVYFGTDTPSANIFAAGEVMAGNILGQGYCAGTGMTIGGVFGRIAGQQAAAVGERT